MTEVTQEDIRRAIRAMIKPMLPPEQVEWVKVLSVDWEKKTMKCHHIDDEEMIIYRCSLGVGSVLKKPKIGTKALIGVVRNLATATYLIDCLDSEEIEITSDLTKLNGDQYGGLIKIEELITQLGKLSARVDGIIDAIKTALPVSGDGGVGYQTAMGVLLDLLVDVEDFTDMENETVVHGE